MPRGQKSRWACVLLGLAVFSFCFPDRGFGQGTAPPGSRSDGSSTVEQGLSGLQPTLTIVKVGKGQGKVAVNPPGYSFKRGTPVTLTALPEPHSVFEGWGGNCAGFSRTCTLVLASDKNVTAAFSLKTYAIQVRPPVNGVIHPFGTVKAAHGERRRFQIIPLPGYRVAEVLVDKVSQGALNSYTFKEITGDHVLEAVFVKQ